jgi:hypothetical protein
MQFLLFFPLYNFISMHDVPRYIDSVSKLFVLLGTVYSSVYFFIFILEHLLYKTILTRYVFLITTILISVLFSLCILHAYRQTYIHLYILIQYICKHTSTLEPYYAMF